MAEHIERDDTGRAITKSIYVDGRRTVPVGGGEILSGTVEGLETLCLEADAGGACTFTVVSGSGATWPGGTLTLAGAGSGLICIPVASAEFRIVFAAALATVEGWCRVYIRRGGAT